ncbi:MBL fold metallo-hydrolase [Deinococcus marmoris]|uniref:Exported protein n=1 Tax=Deinococcus marmoris TaxID=249408 RepID=A0A1U7NZR5_9DEIO|nr:MBL fold metallo-hydrolase [Deinococcus marmoris]OLV18409.1 exported protein [Deinococcus marmoris]
MQLQLIRNATLRLEYAGHTLLIDPFLAEKHSLPPFAGLENNPTTGLPVTPSAVLDGVELTLISHLHADHFDPAAQELLPKDMPIFCQSGDETAIQGFGFQQVTPLAGEVQWKNITLRPTPGQHGSGPILEQMGSVIGLVLQGEGEPTVYWLGDTILTPEVQGVLQEVQPNVVIVHAGGATLGGTVLIMDAGQTLEVCRAASGATVVATHLESLDHCTVSRAALKAAAQDAGIQNLRVPEDGETLKL